LQFSLTSSSALVKDRPPRAAGGPLGRNGRIIYQNGPSAARGWTEDFSSFFRARKTQQNQRHHAPEVSLYEQRRPEARRTGRIPPPPPPENQGIGNRELGTGNSSELNGSAPPNSDACKKSSTRPFGLPSESFAFCGTFPLRSMLRAQSNCWLQARSSSGEVVTEPL